MANLKNKKDKVEQRHERISEQTEKFIQELGEYIIRADYTNAKSEKKIYLYFEKLINILKEQPLKGKNNEVVNLSIFDPLAKFGNSEAKKEVFETFYTFLRDYLMPIKEPIEQIRINAYKKAIKYLKFFFKDDFVFGDDILYGESDLMYDYNYDKCMTDDELTELEKLKKMNLSPEKIGHEKSQILKFKKNELDKKFNDETIYTRTMLRLDGTYDEIIKNYRNFILSSKKILEIYEKIVKTDRTKFDKSTIKIDFNEKMLFFCDIYEIKAKEAFIKGTFANTIIQELENLLNS